MISYKRRQKIAQAACRLVACDYRFEKNLASSQIYRWIQLFDGYLYECNDDPLLPCHFGYNVYLKNIESRYQGYIQELFRNSQSVYIPMSRFQVLADLIQLYLSVWSTEKV